MSSPANSHSGARKQAPVPGPRSAAYKKIVAARKAAKPASRNGGSSAARGKQRKSSAKFSAVKTQQAIVERAKRAIWGSVLKINDAIISLALAGNYSAAKALFEFAGVYSLPEPTVELAPSEPASLPAAAAPASDGDVPESINAFFKSIGLEPAREVPPPQPAA